MYMNKESRNIINKDANFIHLLHFIHSSYKGRRTLIMKMILSSTYVRVTLIVQVADLFRWYFCLAHFTHFTLLDCKSRWIMLTLFLRKIRHYEHSSKIYFTCFEMYSLEMWPKGKIVLLIFQLRIPLSICSDVSGPARCA